MKLFVLIDHLDRLLLRLFEWIAHEFELVTGWDNFILAWLVLGGTVLSENVFGIYLSKDNSQLNNIIFNNIICACVGFSWYKNLVLPFRQRRTLWARNAAEVLYKNSRCMLIVISTLSLTIAALAFARVARFPSMVPSLWPIFQIPPLTAAFYLVCCTPLPPGDGRSVTSEA